MTDYFVDDVTAVIVNRRTLNLTRSCVTSLLQFYPDLHVILVDNRSGDESTGYVLDLAEQKDNVTAFVNTVYTPHHAVGLNMGYLHVETRFFLTLDSDVEVLRGGWIERMLRQFKMRDRMFAVGHVAMNAGPSCTKKPGPKEMAVHFVHPFCALWDEEKFSELGVWFQETGQPACRVCKEAQRAGYFIGRLPGLHPHNDPIPYYVRHAWGGTRHKLMAQADKRRKKQRG